MLFAARNLIFSPLAQTHDVFCRRFENVCFCHHEYIVKNNNVFDSGMFSCAPEVHISLCFTMHFHDFVNALVKIVMCKFECLCVCFHFSIYYDFKHVRRTNVSMNTFHDGMMCRSLQWSGSFVMICKYALMVTHLCFTRHYCLFTRLTF